MCGDCSFLITTNSDSNRNCSSAAADDDFDYDAIEIRLESLLTSYYAPATALSHSGYLLQPPGKFPDLPRQEREH